MSRDRNRSKGTNPRVTAMVFTRDGGVWEMRKVEGLEIHFVVEVTGLTDGMGERETKEFLEIFLETLLGLEEWDCQSSTFLGQCLPTVIMS